MTKKEMAEEILQNSSLMGVSERRFYQNVTRQGKGFIKRLYDSVIESKTETERKQNADSAMGWLYQEEGMTKEQAIEYINSLKGDCDIKIDYKPICCNEPMRKVYRPDNSYFYLCLHCDKSLEPKEQSMTIEERIKAYLDEKHLQESDYEG